MHCVFLGDSERTGIQEDGHPAGTSGASGVQRLGHERMVDGRAAASGEKRMDLSEEIAWFVNMLNFGDILNMDGPLVEIGSRSVFPNSDVGGWQ